MLKKTFASILSLVMVMSLIVWISAEEKTFGKVIELEIGDYISLGKYDNKPIIWRYVADDVNGKLILSDKLLCRKNFGLNSYWEWSCIRTWLNSDADYGNVVYYNVPVPRNIRTESEYCNIGDYYEEAGFMNRENFSDTEKSVIKTVALSTGLPNGEKVFLAEKMFLPDNEQMKIIGNNSGVLGYYVKNIEYATATDTEANLASILNYYWLRTPQVETDKSDETYGSWTQSIWNIDKNRYDFISNDGFYDDVYSAFITSRLGIRPAFYLNEETVQILSGSGTKEDPYVVDGKTPPERFEENGLYGYRNADGDIVVEAKYEKALPFSDGAALVVQPGDDKWSYIDLNGKLLFEKSFYASNNFENGYAVVLVSDEPKYAYINKTGEFANDMLFDEAEDFADGYARVKMNGKWGIVDMKFNFKIPCEYETKDDASNAWYEEHKHVEYNVTVFRGPRGD